MLFRSVDVMDFIYHEMYEAMIGRTTIPYAPYIMLLIKKDLPDEDLSDDDCEDHKVKKPYVKKFVVAPPAPSATTDPAPSSFMADARGIRKQHTPTASIAPQIKKLNWFQRNVLCMKVDIHHEQYNAYCRDLQSAHTQQLILHQLSGARGSPPKASTPTPYNKWGASQYPWVKMEKELYNTKKAPPSSLNTAHTDAEDVDDDTYDEDSGSYTDGDSSGDDGDDDEDDETEVSG